MFLIFASWNCECDVALCIKKGDVMTGIRNIYRCPICGNVVEVLNPGMGELVCCGKPMVMLRENSTDAAQEKHVPMVEKVEGGYLVKVGSTDHPMLEEHYIQWIELLTPTSVLRCELKPHEKPEATFFTHEDCLCAREYCNLHGLWKG